MRNGAAGSAECSRTEPRDRGFIRNAPELISQPGSSAGNTKISPSARIVICAMYVSCVRSQSSTSVRNVAVGSQLAPTPTWSTSPSPTGGPSPLRSRIAGEP
jgi:hypothetical protein